MFDNFILPSIKYFQDINIESEFAQPPSFNEFKAFIKMHIKAAESTQNIIRKFKYHGLMNTR